MITADQLNAFIQAPLETIRGNNVIVKSEAPIQLPPRVHDLAWQGQDPPWAMPRAIGNQNK